LAGSKRLLPSKIASLLTGIPYGLEAVGITKMVGVGATGEVEEGLIDGVVLGGGEIGGSTV
jgi:hypothetical protein